MGTRQHESPCDGIAWLSPAVAGWMGFFVELANSGLESEWAGSV